MSSDLASGEPRQQQNVAAEYEDCTPCRVLGTTRITLHYTAKCSYAIQVRRLLLDLEYIV